jgi:hypothetical protein
MPIVGISSCPDLVDPNLSVPTACPVNHEDYLTRLVIVVNDNFLDEDAY